MRPYSKLATSVTTGHDPRITRLGRFFRRAKIDELSRLFNVLVGHMSFVGPRPDAAKRLKQLNIKPPKPILDLT